MRLDDILQDFLSEAEERFQSIEALLVTLERQPRDAHALAEVFRAAHSLKGTCSFLGFRRLAGIAHAAEDLLSQVRAGQSVLTPAHVGLLLVALDMMRDISAHIAAAGGEGDADFSEETLVQRLAAAARGEHFEVPSTRPREKADKSTAMLRVQGDVFDNLLALSAEMVIAREKILRVPQMPAGVTSHLAQLTARLQEEVLRARLQPVMDAWRSLPRLVRDMAAAAGVSARLETAGGDTLLDRQVLDLLRDPLAHLVRNAIAHGIEPAETRRAQGKAGEGIITISARAADGHVVLTVADDGRGLDMSAIEARAAAIVGQGVQTPQSLADMIFMRGFSTAQSVSDISGRGVGLDAVRTQIENIGGSVSVILPENGDGTAFVMRVPLTLAMMPAVLVSALGQRFAIARGNVAEICLLPAVLPRAGGQNIFYWRGMPLPVFTLPQVLAEEADAAQKTGRFGLVVEADGMAGVFTADEIFSISDAVIKPLPPLLDETGFYLGLVLLDDGFAALVPDVRRILLRHAAPNMPRCAPPAVQNPCCNMLFFSVRGKSFALDAADVRHINRATPEAFQTARDGTLYACIGDDVLAVQSLAEGIEADAGHIIVRRHGGAIPCSRVDDVRPVYKDLCAGGIRVIDGRAVEVLPLSENIPVCGHILLVDDSAFFCDLLTPLLRDAGYDVDIAGDATSALNMRDSGAVFDVIISDIEMPGMDGLDFARQVKAADSAWRGIPLLALSAHATRHDEQRGHGAGFDDFITKFDRGGLLAKISALRKGAA